MSAERPASGAGVMVEGRDGKLPWPHRKVWALAAAPLLVAGTGLGTWFGVVRIENKLTDEARSDLSAAGIDPSGLSIHFDYRDGEAVGMLPAGITRAEAEAAVSHSLLREFTVKATEVAAPAVPAPSSSSTAPPVQLGSTEVRAELTSAGRVVLTGTVPTEAEHRTLLQAATEAVGADQVDDRIVVSGLSPAVPGDVGRVESLAAVVATFDGAETALATLTDDSLDLVMRGATGDTAQKAQEAMDAAPVFADYDIEGGGEMAAPLELLAELDGGVLTLIGTVPTEAQHQMLLDAAVASFGSDGVDDQLIVSGNPSTAEADSGVETLASALAALEGAEVGSAELSDSGLTVVATVSDPDAAEALEALEGSAGGVPTTVEVTVAEAPEVAIGQQMEALQGELDSLADEIRANIVFDSGSAELGPAARATLDKVAAAMERYPLPVVQVEGHTDSNGPRAANQALSQARAESVVAYLVTAGIDPSRLTAVGFGEDVPLVSNSTAAGRAQNRRVVFTPLPEF